MLTIKSHAVIGNVFTCMISQDGSYEDVNLQMQEGVWLGSCPASLGIQLVLAGPL